LLCFYLRQLNSSLFKDADQKAKKDIAE